MDLKRSAVPVVAVLLLAGLVWVGFAAAGEDGVMIPVPPEYKLGAGLSYSMDLVKDAQRLSFLLLLAGWVFVLLGALAA